MVWFSHRTTGWCKRCAKKRSLLSFHIALETGIPTCKLTLISGSQSLYGFVQERNWGECYYCCMTFGVNYVLYYAQANSQPFQRNVTKITGINVRFQQTRLSNMTFRLMHISFKWWITMQKNAFQTSSVTRYSFMKIFEFKGPKKILRWGNQLNSYIGSAWI